MRSSLTQVVVLSFTRSAPLNMQWNFQLAVTAFGEFPTASPLNKMHNLTVQYLNNAIAADVNTTRTTTTRATSDTEMLFNFKLCS